MMVMKIVIASDSFKGTLSSLDICRLWQEELVKYPHITAEYLPIADGGEGSLDAIAYSIKGHYIPITVKDPYFKDIDTRYYVDDNNNAYIETASCAGLTLIKELNPMKTTTYGLGEQVLDAIKNGCKKIYIFLGGSATNDGGCGLFAAIGAKFFNKEGKEFIPTGGTLEDIVRIDNSITLNALGGAQIIGMCDVNNSLYGLNGAAYVFAPQKGADEKIVVELDKGLRHLATIAKRDLDKDVADVTGAGAAGGLGFGILAFGDGLLRSGIETILNLCNFDTKIIDADYVISGEGKLDKQSFLGKAIGGITARCQEHSKRLVLIVGASELTLQNALKIYPLIDRIIVTNSEGLPFKEIAKNAPKMYCRAISLFFASQSHQSVFTFDRWLL